MSGVYEVVGAIDAGAAAAVGTQDGAILVEQDETSEYLIARPKDGDE